jgi:hypothetical protein
VAGRKVAASSGTGITPPPMTNAGGLWMKSQLWTTLKNVHFGWNG